MTTPSVSDSSPAGGTGFTLSVTVRNAGGAAGEETTLRYYRSADATITVSDTQIGTEAVAELAAEGGGSHSVDLTAPTTPGTYYYGACVDVVAGESDTTNNCSASVRVTVPEPRRPDLVVASPSVSHGRPVTGTAFRLSATVSNDGDRSAPASTLRYYRSTDATITTSDAPVGTSAVSELAEAGSSSHSVDLTAPATAGPYYYGACVEAVADESDTTNNCSASVEVVVQDAVTGPQGQPDLTVTNEFVSDNRPLTGTTFTLSATVRNDGDGAAAATTLRYFRSTDATITTTDTQVGTDDVGALGATGSSAVSIVLTAPATAGAYYYGACVDAVTDESDTADNCSSSVKVDVEEPKYPDLEVGTPSVDDTSPVTGATITLSATVSNAGDARSPATTLRYFRSTDATITAGDAQVGSDDVGALAAAGTSAESISLTVPATAGEYYYGACVDALADETDTTNNCSTSVAVTVSEPEQTGTSVEVTAEDDKGFAPVGDTVDLSARVLDEEGEQVHGATVTWSSSDTSVATVDSSGVMTAVGTGWATLTATSTASGSSMQSSVARSVATRSRASSGGPVPRPRCCSGSIRMHVVQPVGRIVLDPDSLSFDAVNFHRDVTATFYDENDNVMQCTYFSWSSADEDVATVTERPFSARVEASVESVGEGTTTVTLNANGSAVATASVTVTLPTARVTVSSPSLTFQALGGTQTVTVSVLDENGDEDEDASYYWTTIHSPCCRGDFDISAPPSVVAAEAGDDGLEITAEAKGSASLKLSAYREDENGNTILLPDVASALINVTVYQVAASLTVSPDTASLAVDGTTTLRASLTDANGHDIRLAEGDQGGVLVFWTTSDSAVATVAGADADEHDNAGATATVTGERAGSATITGSTGRGGGGIRGTATVTVTE